MEMPEGLVYREEFVSPLEEKRLIEKIRKLKLEPFRYRGFLGRRKTISFGYDYDFETFKLSRIEKMPKFLEKLEARAEEFASNLEQVSIQEYAPGAGIGWHRDLPHFGEVVGISLGGQCTMKFRRGETGEWDKFSILLQPRSAYLLAGAARREWQHHIPPTKELRWSITFRT